MELLEIEGHSLTGTCMELLELEGYSLLEGVNLTAQDLLCQDARILDLYFNISEMKLSITSLYIIFDAPKYDIIWTENSDVIDSFISEILKYKSWILASWPKRS